MNVLNDILGTKIQVGATVVTSHNNRIIMGRVTKAYPESWQVQIEPLPWDTNARRDIPKMKPFRRQEYNVFVVTDKEMLVGTLKGYCHNSGEFDEED